MQLVVQCRMADPIAARVPDESMVDGNLWGPSTLRLGGPDGGAADILAYSLACSASARICVCITSEFSRTAAPRAVQRENRQRVQIN